MPHKSKPIQIACHQGAGNETTFNMLDSLGAPLNLSQLTGVVVTVEINNPAGANWIISSTTSAIVFAADILTIKFGLLQLPNGHYYPKISYTHDTDNEPEVLVGHGKETEILLTAYQ